MRIDEIAPRSGPEIETERLLLRQWHEADFWPFATFFADAEMSSRLGGPEDRPNAWRRMASIIGHWELRGYGPWAVAEREGGTFVGSVGLWCPEGWPELELGYWLTRDGQGNGFATEAGQASIDYAFQTLRAETLVSYIGPDNEPSKRVAEALGARYEKMIALLEHGPHCVYRYDRQPASR